MSNLSLYRTVGEYVLQSTIVVVATVAFFGFGASGGTAARAGGQPAAGRQNFILNAIIEYIRRNIIYYYNIIVIYVNLPRLQKLCYAIPWGALAPPAAGVFLWMIVTETYLSN